MPEVGKPEFETKARQGGIYALLGINILFSDAYMLRDVIFDTFLSSKINVIYHFLAPLLMQIGMRLNQFRCLWNVKM